MIINVEEDQKIKEEHIAWYTRNDLEVNSISLFEIIKVTYKHPDVPEYATISCLEEKYIKTTNRSQRSNVGHLELLENAQNVVNIIEEKECII